jgi:glycogenin glucosyltransferase
MLATALAKLHSFRLTQYSRVIYLDADTLPVKPISHLFTESSDFAAVPDIGWPDIFNSGVMLLTPSSRSYSQMLTMLSEEGSWDGADQGLLNEWRGNDWHKLSFVYNTTPSGIYTCVHDFFFFQIQFNA